MCVAIGNGDVIRCDVMSLITAQKLRDISTIHTDNHDNDDNDNDDDDDEDEDSIDDGLQESTNSYVINRDKVIIVIIQLSVIMCISPLDRNLQVVQ